MLGILRQVQGWVKLKGDSDGTKIGNIGDKLKVTNDEGDSFHLFSESTIGGNSSGNVIDFTVPAGKTLEIIDISYSGENRSKIEIFQDAAKIEGKNLYYGEFNGNIPMHKKTINDAEHLIIKFTSIVNKSGKYTASVYGRLI